MKRAFVATMTALLLAAGGAQAQQQKPTSVPPPPQPDRALIEQRRQETVQRMDHLMVLIRKLNETMDREKSHPALREIGRNMEQVCEGIGLMQRRLGVAETTPIVADVPARVRAMDRVQERLRVMSRELEETQQVLRNVVRMEDRRGEASSVEERSQLGDRQRDLAEHVVRVALRLRALEEWSATPGAPHGAHDAVADMTQLHERLRVMVESFGQACRDKDLPRDRDRLHELDRLHDRLHVMLREVEEMTEVLPRGYTE